MNSSEPPRGLLLNSAQVKTGTQKAKTKLEIEAALKKIFPRNNEQSIMVRRLILDEVRDIVGGEILDVICRVRVEKIKKIIIEHDNLGLCLTWDERWDLIFLTKFNWEIIQERRAEYEREEYKWRNSHPHGNYI